MGSPSLSPKSYCLENLNKESDDWTLNLAYLLVIYYVFFIDF